MSFETLPWDSGISHNLISLSKMSNDHVGFSSHVHVHLYSAVIVITSVWVDFLLICLNFLISGLDHDPDLDPDLLHGPEAGMWLYTLGKSCLKVCLDSLTTGTFFFFQKNACFPSINLGVSSFIKQCRRSFFLLLFCTPLTSRSPVITNTGLIRLR